MAKKPLQASLYQKRGVIKQELQPISLSKEQKKYVRSYFKQNWTLFRLAVILIFASVILQISIPLVTDIFISRFAYSLELDKLVKTIIFLGAVGVAYLITSFYSIKYEKLFIIKLINKLRREWVSLLLKRPLFSLRHRDVEGLLAKITFHLSLVQIGMSNALFLFIQWVLLTFGLAVVTFLIDTTMFVVVLLMIPINVLIFALGYIVSKYYVSQDQTMYSKILRYVAHIFHEFPVIKLNKKEKSALSHLDELVEIDTYFRVRRDLWMHYGDRIIFVLIAFFTAVFYLVQIYFPFIEIEHSAEYIIYGAILALLIRLIYLSLRVGLFSFPLKLGFALCVSDKFLGKGKPIKPIEAFQTISFKSPKVRITPSSDYVKNVEYSFKKGQRVLIVGTEGSGKSSLGTIFAGMAFGDRGRPWVVNVDHDRLLYKYWQKRMQGLYIVHPEFQTEATILEMFGRRFSQEQPLGTIEKILNQLGDHPELDFIFDHPKVLGKRVNKRDFSFVEKALLQMAYCLFHEPAVLVIDNLWLDLNHERVNKMIKLLDRKLKKTLIIAFAQNDNSLIHYDKTYSL